MNLQINYGDRTALVGKNGCGKSTLIKILKQKLKPHSGKVKIGTRVKLGFHDQQIAFDNEQKTILETYREKCPSSQQEARNTLGSFLFYGDEVFKKVVHLSGGERSRLKLCLLIQQDINTLVLDEPTNHLDIDAIEMLEESLKEFKGTILFISHDRYFINKIATQTLDLNNKTLTKYPGNYDYYKQKKTQQLHQKESKNQIKKQASNTGPNRSEEAKKQNTFKLKEIEVKIEELEIQIKQKQTQSQTHTTDHKKLQQIEIEKTTLKQKRDTLLEQWVQMSG
ncbi:ATP-binding cassette domain-containing protein [Proteinivorax tanatarense]|uniref:ATP-binding cassette domain-containing protein n=1 Tax=Proteinivorax tanatarense TaxID=1260629 RepID=A0AAU7VQU5_9FIRM